MDRARRVDRACEDAVGALRDRFGESLWALALYGSAARDPAGHWNDLDFYAIVRAPSPREEIRRLAQEALGRHLEEPPSALCRTPESFDADVTPLMLDLALDARILYDPRAYLKGRLARLREIIGQAGLRREDLERGNFLWLFDTRPRGDWSITWDGYRDEAA